jgi:hypothetical protein
MRSQSRHSRRAVPTKRSAIAVRLRRPHRGLDNLDAFAREDSVEASGELGVAVADQVAKARWLLLECPSEVAGLLCDPLSGRVGGAADEVDAAAAHLDEEEHVQPLKRDPLDREEVDCEDALRRLAQKRPPGHARTLTGRTEARLAQDLPDGRRRDSHAEPIDLADDPLVTPAWVLAGETEDELPDLAADRRPPDPTGVGPAASNESPMPTK